jgi:hypothetical protein
MRKPPKRCSAQPHPHPHHRRRTGRLRPRRPRCAAGPPIATNSRPRARARRRAPRDGERGDDGDDGDGGAAPDAAPPRNRHGNRSVPAPAQFSLAELSDDCLLTQREVAALGRWAVSTVETWRRRPHPLPWITIAAGQVRYRAGDLRQFLASGKPRKRKPSPSPAANTTTKIHTAEPAQ